MPCRDGGPDYSFDAELRERLDKVTRLLCGLCRNLTKNRLEGHIDEVPELPEWWQNHQEEDRRREKAERKEREEQREVQKALSKLSSRERVLLRKKNAL